MSFTCIFKTNYIFIDLKQLVKVKDDELSKLQSKVDKLQIDNKILIDTNSNLVKCMEKLEKYYKPV